MTNNNSGKSPWNDDGKEALLDAEAQKARQEEEEQLSASELFDFIKQTLGDTPHTPEERQARLVTFLTGLVEEVKAGKLVGICGVIQDAEGGSSDFKIGTLRPPQVIGGLQVLSHGLICRIEADAEREYL